MQPRLPPRTPVMASARSMAGYQVSTHTRLMRPVLRNIVLCESDEILDVGDRFAKPPGPNRRDECYCLPTLQCCTDQFKDHKSRYTYPSVCLEEAAQAKVHTPVHSRRSCLRCNGTTVIVRQVRRVRQVTSTVCKCEAPMHFPS